MLLWGPGGRKENRSPSGWGRVVWRMCSLCSQKKMKSEFSTQTSCEEQQNDSLMRVLFYFNLISTSIGPVHKTRSRGILKMQVGICVSITKHMFILSFTRNKCVFCTRAIAEDSEVMSVSLHSAEYLITAF